jgi:hypothetical protein
MLTEVDIGGVYVSPFLVTLVLALPFYLPVRAAVARTGVLSRVWYPPLFEVGLFVIVLFCVTAVS